MRLRVMDSHLLIWKTTDFSHALHHPDGREDNRVGNVAFKGGTLQLTVCCDCCSCFFFQPAANGMWAGGETMRVPTVCKREREREGAWPACVCPSSPPLHYCSRKDVVHTDPRLSSTSRSQLLSKTQRRRRSSSFCDDELLIAANPNDSILLNWHFIVKPQSLWVGNNFAWFCKENNLCLYKNIYKNK